MDGDIDSEDEPRQQTFSWKIGKIAWTNWNDWIDGIQIEDELYSRLFLGFYIKTI